MKIKVGGGRLFDVVNKFKELSGEGFMGGVDFRADGIASYQKAAMGLLTDLKTMSGIENPKIQINIFDDSLPNKQITDDYTKALKVKFGGNLIENWYQHDPADQTSKKHKDLNANMTITIVK